MHIVRSGLLDFVDVWLIVFGVRWGKIEASDGEKSWIPTTVVDVVGFLFLIVHDLNRDLNGLCSQDRVSCTLALGRDDNGADGNGTGSIGENEG